MPKKPESTLLYGELKTHLGARASEILKDAQTDIDVAIHADGTLSTPQLHQLLCNAYQFGRFNFKVAESTFSLVWNKANKQFNCLKVEKTTKPKA